jgi:hypothetical protein
MSNFEICTCGEPGCVGNIFKNADTYFKEIPILFMTKFYNKVMSIHAIEDHEVFPERECIFDDYTDDLDLDNPDWLLWEWEMAK